MTIPLESVAFDLQGRFESWTGEPFSAEAEVRASIGKPGLPYASRRLGRQPVE